MTSTLTNLRGFISGPKNIFSGIKEPDFKKNLDIFLAGGDCGQLLQDLRPDFFNFLSTKKKLFCLSRTRFLFQRNKKVANLEKTD